ncbi:MAG: hypothetical protein AB1553_04460 [Nitrospirota bacterium]
MDLFEDGILSNNTRWKHPRLSPNVLKKALSELKVVVFESNDRVRSPFEANIIALWKTEEMPDIIEGPFLALFYTENFTTTGTVVGTEILFNVKNISSPIGHIALEIANEYDIPITIREAIQYSNEPAREELDGLIPIRRHFLNVTTGHSCFTSECTYSIRTAKGYISFFRDLFIKTKEFAKELASVAAHH